MSQRQRVLIYRLGSLGDTVVALPALHLIKRAFPSAERRLLTNTHIGGRAAPITELLNGSGLIHNYIEYPIGTRNIQVLRKLRTEIQEYRPDVLIYLAQPRGIIKLLRDVLFFRFCGIRDFIGLPYSADKKYLKKLRNDQYEYEGARLARCINVLGAVHFENTEFFDLNLTSKEREVAVSALNGCDYESKILAVSIGAKTDVQDWGDENWNALLAGLSGKLKGWLLVLLGAESEKLRSGQLSKSWNGASVNLCGALKIRESAAVLGRSSVFIGHDSGPMHLAGAVGTPCVAIFSSRSMPGRWFPKGSESRVLYHYVPCLNCNLEVCVEYEKVCIRSIAVEEVERNVYELLNDVELR